MKVPDLEAYELKRLHKNAWHASECFRNKIHGAAASSAGEKIIAHLSPSPERSFFRNEKYWTAYLDVKKEADRATLPGAAYFGKIREFVKQHYQIGIKYMEFIRSAVRSA
jgi:hypothetical protein